MIFNSIVFLIFVIIFFPLYWLINNRLSVKSRNIFTTLSSYLFYGWWDWRFLVLIIISSLVDFTIGIQLFKIENKRKRKQLLYLSVIVNIGILAFFKYFNFFIDSLKDLFSVFAYDMNMNSLEILLPVGISFYTFQTLSYTIDIYREKLEPTRDIFSFFAFVSFFPQLVAGPIERASRLLYQFTEKKKFEYNNAVIGLRLLLWGMFKKVVLADNFGVLADQIFDPNLNPSGVVTLIGAFCFAIQIYADFSGYSDMAIGLSKMLGIDLMKNFKTPYFSVSLRNFWRRWHISLSTWFRDYVYIPLGGNEGSTLKIHLNIFITFLLSGLWHGAKITFVIWGALHGICLILERVIKLKINKNASALFVTLIVVLLWIPFRAESTKHLLDLSESILHFSTYSLDQFYIIISDFSTRRFIVLMMILFLFMLLEWQLKSLDFSEWISKKTKLIRIGVYYFILTLILVLGNFSVKPQFIYFQF